MRSVTRPAGGVPSDAHLRPVGPERGFFVVEADSLGVEIDRGVPVVLGKGRVALILEANGLLLRCRHLAPSCGPTGRGRSKSECCCARKKSQAFVSTRFETEDWGGSKLSWRFDFFPPFFFTSRSGEVGAPLSIRSLDCLPPAEDRSRLERGMLNCGVTGWCSATVAQKVNPPGRHSGFRVLS